MKGRILITALALVLALGGLIAINRVEAAKALPVGMEVLDSTGDSSVTEGLTVDYRVSAENCLRWYTRYDPATGENESDFYMTYRRVNGSAGWRIADGDDWHIYSNLLAVGGTDPLLSDMLRQANSPQGEKRGDGVHITTQLYPHDYYDAYPLRLVNASVVRGVSLNYFGMEDLPFDKLRIPTTENDFFEIEFFFRDPEDPSSGYVSGYCSDYVENQFASYSVCDKDGALVTVGFDADVQPQADWAPEGFGLWYIPKQQKGIMAGVSPALEACRLVYPLDIENQRVALLERSDDGAHILLVTVEEEHYVLRVLDSTDYHLVQTLELDGAEVHEGSTSRDYVAEDEYGPYRPTTESARYQYTPEGDPADGVGWFQVEERFYPAVTVRQGENFLAVMMGSRLAVLAPEGEGYDARFVCDIPSYGSVMRWDEINNSWVQDEPDDWYTDTDDLGDPDGQYSYDWRYPVVSEAYTMAYNGRYLAVATYYGGSDLMLTVYGPGGLQYGARVRNSVLNWSMNTQPVCQDVVASAEEFYRPQPGLSWS